KHRKKSYGLCLLVVLLFMLHSNAQSDSDRRNVGALKKIPNCFVEPTYRQVDTGQVSSHAYRYIISQLYSTIAGVQPGGLLSGGSFDPVAGSFALNYAQELKIPKKVDISKWPDSMYCNANTNDLLPQANHSWFLALTAGGSIISNNIGVLFNNSKFNAGSSVTGKLLIPLGNSLIIGGPGVDSVLKKKQAIEYQRWSDKTKIWRAVNSTYTRINLDETATKREQETLTIADLRKQSRAVQGELDKIATQKSEDSAKYIAYRLKLSDSLLSLIAQADSLERDRFALKLKLDSLHFIEGVIVGDEQNAADRDANWAHYGERQYMKIDSFYD